MADEPVQKDIKIFLGVVSVLAVGTLAIVVLLSINSGRKPEFPEPSRRLSEFSLTERSGVEVSRASVSNQFLVVNFIQTRCSISCAEVNRHMSDIQRLVAGDKDVLLLSLSVDPRSDTPPALTRFAEKFGADSKRWLFLTGKKSSVYELIETSFLRFETDRLYPEVPGYFLGLEQIALVDKTGRVRRYFDGQQRSSPKAVVEMIQQLRREY